MVVGSEREIVAWPRSSCTNLGSTPLGLMVVSQGNRRKSSPRSEAGGGDILSSAGVWRASCCSSSSSLLRRWMAVVEAGTSTDGLIAFRRWLDPDSYYKSAIFTMNPNGSHISQITYPPRDLATATLCCPQMRPKVAFNRRCRPSHCYGSRIMVVDRQYGRCGRVTHVTPDGKSIAFRRIATRYNRKAISPESFLYLTASLMWL